MSKRYLYRSDADRILRRGSATLTALGEALRDEVAARLANAATDAEASAIIEGEVYKVFAALDVLERNVLDEIASTRPF